MDASRKKWSDLGLVDQISVVAQLIGAFSIIPASVLSYMAWSESNAARTDQREFFYAEKGPSLGLDVLPSEPPIVMPGLNSPTRMVRAKLTNNGSSAIKGISVRLLTNTPSSDEVGPRYERANMRLAIPPKGEQVIDIARVADIEQARHVPFTSVRAVHESIADGAAKPGEEDVAFLFVRYTGLFDRQYEDRYVIFMAAN